MHVFSFFVIISGLFPVTSLSVFNAFCYNTLNSYYSVLGVCVYHLYYYYYYCCCCTSRCASVANAIDSVTNILNGRSVSVNDWLVSDTFTT